MQSNGYRVDIVAGGVVQDTRADGVVAVPFGQDYVIRLTNTTGKRGLAHVSLDGQAVTGGGVIVPAHGTLDLERPTDKSVTFRFASTDSRAAAEHGKAGPDEDGTKGLVRVEWLPETGYSYSNPYTYARDRSDYEPGSSLRRCKSPRQSDCEPRSTTSSSVEKEDCCHQSTPTSGGIRFLDEGPAVVGQTLNKGGLSSGVTVEGRYSSQTFRSVHFDIDNSVPSTVMLLKLKGYVREGMVYPEAIR